jgi:mRNA interferase MazF
MKQSDIWLVSLDPTIGAEIKKTRPAIIVSDDSLGKLPLKIIIPVTDWKDRYEIAPWMIRLVPDSVNLLTKISSADCFQIRSISAERFIKKIGDIDNKTMEKIRRAIKVVLTIQ